MSFTTPVFLFLFFPAVILGYYLIHPKLRNLVLLAASFAFYTWGEPEFVWMFAIAIVLNYAFGLWIGRSRERGLASRAALVFALITDLGLLFSTKDFAISSPNLM